MTENLENIEIRLKECAKKEAQLTEQLKVVEDEEQKASIEAQLEKIDALMKHLSKQRIDLINSEN